jgi:hypothetical protein
MYRFLLVFLPHLLADYPQMRRLLDLPLALRPKAMDASTRPCIAHLTS